MKFISSLLVLFVTVFLVAECLPSSPREEPELVFVPLEAQGDELTRLHEHNLRLNPYEEDEDDESLGQIGFPGLIFPQFFSGLDAFVRNMFQNLRGFSVNPTNWGNVTNSTSTQKVIDGYLVTVNETTYQKNDNASVFQVKVIDVKPLPSTSTEGHETGTKTESSEIDSKENTPVNSAESVEDKGDNSNEIPKEKNADAETFDNHHSETAELLETREYHPLDKFNEVDNSIDGHDMEPISLLGDTYVNELQDKMKGGMIMVPHDVEVFDVDDGKSVYSYGPYPPNTFREKTQKIVT